GSRSMISTRSPIAASAVPRLIAVVVLPTPPFWLATDSTRMPLAASADRSGAPAGSVGAIVGASVMCGLDVGILSYSFPCWTTAFNRADPHDAPRGIGDARDQRCINGPIFRRGGQFSLYISSFEEQRLRAACQQGIGAFDELFEWRERPGGHDLHGIGESIH